MASVSVSASASHAQSVLDQSNTAIIQRDTKDQPEPPPASRVQVETDAGATDTEVGAAESGTFIGAIRVQGTKRIPINAFSAAIEPFVGRTLSKADLTAVSRAVGSVARERGYKFASAYIAPQSLALGILSVTLDEGAISSVRVEGSKNAQVRRILAPLEGEPILYAEVERRILLVGDVPGMTIGRIRFNRENGRGVLTVTVNETRLSGRAGFDTLGTKSVGPVRAIVSASATSLAVAGDQATIQGAATPIQPNELAFVALRYALPVDADGTVVSGAIAYGRSEPSGFLARFDSVGRSLTYSFAINRTLLRSRKTNLFLNFGFDQLSSRQSLIGLRARDDRITSLSLSLSGNRQLWGGRLSSEAKITQGLGGFNATQRGDPLSSRPDADAVFTKLNLNADWIGSVSGPVSLRVATALQVASAPLFAEDEVGIGGPRFGRAFSFSERSGDNGALGLIEVRSDFNKITSWLESAQAYTFIDGGKVTNLRDGFGGGTLYSGGGGVRGRMGKVIFGVETAFPLNEDRFESGDRSPRFNLQLSTSF